MCSVDNVDGEESESMDNTPVIAKTVPLILTTTLQKDVKVRKKVDYDFAQYVKYHHRGIFFVRNFLFFASILRQ